MSATAPDHGGRGVSGDEPIFWPATRLVEAFRARRLSPVDVTRDALRRIDAFDSQLHSYLSVSRELALEQARTAERRYRDDPGDHPPMLGVPVSIKDLFDVRGEPTSLGSLVYRGTIAEADSPVVERLRGAGAVFLGKSNTAEFGQSATTENLLGPGCVNPWDTTRTAGGSSGGAAAGVAAGLAGMALGSDGGGSIRVPSAMCGLFGIKPTFDASLGGSSFRAMTEFVCAGPIARCAADARVMLEVMLGRGVRSQRRDRLRIAWCPAPEARPIDLAVRAATQAAVSTLADLGHLIDEVTLPIDGWVEAFGPLVLADEWRFRRHLLLENAEGLTEYARRTIEAAEHVTDEAITNARRLKNEIRARVETMFERYDLIVTPTTATVAFPIEQRPAMIDGQKADGLWGPFPFTAPFNVSGSPAASLPVGTADGMPVGLQVVGPAGAEARILDLCEQLESAVKFSTRELERRWRTAVAPAAPSRDRAADPDLVVERRHRVMILTFNRPSRRNSLTTQMLERVRRALGAELPTDVTAVILTGTGAVFSAGMDLSEIGNGLDDRRIDDGIAATTAAIRGLAIPVLAAIEGPCIGAALDIAVACDVRVAGAGALFAIPAVRLGILYRPDAIAEMVLTLGRETASRLLMLGDTIDAGEAAATRIATRVVARGAALQTALAVAEQSAATPLSAMRATKQLIDEVMRTIAPGLASWDGIRDELLGSETRRQLVAAALARTAGSAAPDTEQ